MSAVITPFQNAKCSLCKLARPEHRPLQSEVRPALYTIILDLPDQTDIEVKRCGAGRYAIDLNMALKLAGIKRSECNIIYVSACSTWDLDAVRRDASTAYRKTAEGQLLRSAGYTTNPYDPVSNCLPRFYTDINMSIAGGARNIICMGDLAVSTIKGGKHSADKIRGCGEYNAEMSCKVFYTIHPRRIYGEPIYKDIFRNDIKKAVRYFTDTLDWPEPKIYLPGSYAEAILALELLKGSKLISYDLETDDINSWANIRCIGLSNKDVAVVIPIRSIDGKLYRWQTENGIIPVYSILANEIKDFLKGKYGKVIGHNAGNFDRRIVEWSYGYKPELELDTMLCHLLMDNELPHRLGFLGSSLTDYTEAWKADNTANEARSDQELHTYCGKDCIVTARVAPVVFRGMKDNNQYHLYSREKMLQAAGVDMSNIGMRIDIDARAKLLGEYREKIANSKAVLTQAFGVEFNPRSSPDLKEALYGSGQRSLGLLPCAFSKKTKEPSTNDDAVREMMVSYGLDDKRYNILHNLRLFKSANQLIQLSLLPMQPYTIGKFLKENGEYGTGILDSSWTVHPSYNRLPTTGRYSSSDPNLQNINAIMRRMYVPRKGNCFIACDANALEAVLIAEESGAQLTIDCLKQGLDLHNETMERVYGNGIWTLPGAPNDRRTKGKGEFKSSRNTIKNVRYANNYGAGIKRIWDQATAAEDENGNLLYRGLSIGDIEEIVLGSENVKGLRQIEPEIPEWWKKTHTLFKQQGYIADTIWGRKRKFRRKQTLPGIVNHPIQAGGFHIIAEAMIEILYGEQDWFATERVDRSPIDYTVLQYSKTGAFTGLVTQTHDSLMFEIGEAYKDAAIDCLTRVMTRRRKVGAVLTYTCECKSGYNWEEV